LIQQPISSLYSRSPQIQKIAQSLAKEKTLVQISNLNGSAFSFAIAEISKKTALPFLLVLNDKEEAAYLFNDLERILGNKNLLFYPGSYKNPLKSKDPDNTNISMRTEVLNRLHTGESPPVIVTYPLALFEKVVAKKTLEKNTLQISVQDQISLDFVNEVLFSYDFNRVDFVAEPGEFAVRGGLVDVFSFSHDLPYRIEFFGEEIERIRTFDIETQLSTADLTSIQIVPNIENKLENDVRESFLASLPKNTVLYTKNKELLCGQLDEFFKNSSENFAAISSENRQTQPKLRFISGTELRREMSNFRRIERKKKAEKKAELQVKFDTNPQPVFYKQFELLAENLRENTQKGIANYLCCANEKQKQRFQDIFSSLEREAPQKKVKYTALVLPLSEGFIDLNAQIACYTDHQIFERYHKFHLKNNRSKKQKIALKEFNSLEVGDYVTHMDHGIGKFGGLQKIDVEGKPQEAIKLIYGDRDILYISIHALHKISKFNGKDGSPPKIFKLGSGAWNKLKQKTKKRVKEIAFNLIALYAKRKLKKGFQCVPDSHLQHELEASFLFEDTPDQLRTTQEIKKDMESVRPMDRLVCGDVGFGKTEVAIRAAFKAADNGKQVAVLVPTTLLAFQHFKSFSKRLKDFPVTVDYLNRFRTTKDRTRILKELKEGKIDILIGTHQLTSQKVIFNDLGLLIVDEEQKFGVAVKDQLKTLRENVDTLTLTATPIPRTLQFSLMAARDLSVINTPPPNRHPIETEVIRLDLEIIREAIAFEISRGGQVFFIHNRVQNIDQVAEKLQKLLPGVKIGIGHGQMEGKKLENKMMAFMSGDFDVLVATTIIESGLDVPNANTLFINDAQRFGLSDLHQMRGRVGRSNKKAFCYLITPPFQNITDEARKRIEALELFSDLGSGINIAMKDLEIRGAGDLLGGEQSGFINDIGFETYQKILQETILELKENEFQDLYAKEQAERKTFVKEIQIDSDFEMRFPDDYINVVSERLNLYKKLGELRQEEDLKNFENSITDRFGGLPTQAVDLMDSVRIKWFAKALGLEKLILKRERMIGYFISDQQSEFYQTPAFTRVLNHVQQNPKTCVLKEKETKNGRRLLITWIRIDSVKKAVETLKTLAGK
jgi:transcription-repair coupling factor (superfamily II helicase)